MFYNFIYKSISIWFYLQMNSFLYKFYLQKYFQSNFIKKTISTTLICKNNSHPILIIKKKSFKSFISKNYF